MVYPPGNGRVAGTPEARNKRFPGELTAYEQKPLGNPPRSLNREQVALWNRIKKEMPPQLLTQAFRLHLEACVKTGHRFFKLSRYFEKRGDEIEAAGGEWSDAFLTDDGKKHPLVTTLKDAEISFTRQLDTIGATAKSQANIMHSLGATKESIERAEMRKLAQRYLTGGR